MPLQNCQGFTLCLVSKKNVILWIVHGSRRREAMAISSTDVFDHDVHRYRIWFVALGAALILLGIVAAGSSLATTYVSMLLLASILLLGGIVRMVAAFSARDWTGSLGAAPRSAGRLCRASLRADIWPRWLCGYRNATPQTGSWDADVLDGIGGTGAMARCHAVSRSMVPAYVIP